MSFAIYNALTLYSPFLLFIFSLPIAQNFISPPVLRNSLLILSCTQIFDLKLVFWFFDSCLLCVLLFTYIKTFNKNH